MVEIIDCVSSPIILNTALNAHPVARLNRHSYWTQCGAVSHDRKRNCGAVQSVRTSYIDELHDYVEIRGDESCRGGVHTLHGCVKWSSFWRIRAMRAWRLPGRWPDGGRRSTVARWTRRRAAPAYAPIPDLTKFPEAHMRLRFGSEMWVQIVVPGPFWPLFDTPNVHRFLWSQCTLLRHHMWPNFIKILCLGDEIMTESFHRLTDWLIHSPTDGHRSIAIVHWTKI